MLHDHILFDLDGTLTDPGEGITNSVMHALGGFGIREDDRSALYRFIGPPLMDSFARFYGFSPEDCRLAVKYYREYYADKGIFENALYAGIPELLSVLKKSGAKIILATSKPEKYAVKILEHFEIEGFFDVTAGAEMDESRSRKSEVIAYAVRLAGLTETGRAVMVGDREHDVIGARECGMDCVGVLYGYGTREELESAGARRIAADTDELRGILLE